MTQRHFGLSHYIKLGYPPSWWRQIITASLIAVAGLLLCFAGMWAINYGGRELCERGWCVDCDGGVCR